MLQLGFTSFTTTSSAREVAISEQFRNFSVKLLLFTSATRRIIYLSGTSILSRQHAAAVGDIRASAYTPEKLKKIYFHLIILLFDAIRLISFHYDGHFKFPATSHEAMPSATAEERCISILTPNLCYTQHSTRNYRNISSRFVASGLLYVFTYPQIFNESLLLNSTFSITAM